MNQLGLIDESALAQQQFELINNWMEGNHPEYASILDDVEALTQEHDKTELFFAHKQLDISENNLITYSSDLKEWLRQSDDQLKQSTDALLEERFSAKPCGCQNKPKAKGCCCKAKQWLLWLALASVFFILINLKQYLVASIFVIAALVISKPKFLHDVL